MRAMWTYLVVSISLIMIVAGMQPSRVSTVGEEKPWSTGIPRSPSGFSGSSRRAACTFVHNLEQVFWEMRDNSTKVQKKEFWLCSFFVSKRSSSNWPHILVGRVFLVKGTAATSDEVMIVLDMCKRRQVSRYSYLSNPGTVVVNMPTTCNNAYVLIVSGHRQWQITTISTQRK